MNNDRSDERLDRLFALARTADLSRPEREAGFEGRVMARIGARRREETPFFAWTWRLVPFFAALVIIMGVWAYAVERQGGTDLSAVTKIGGEETMLMAYLTGE